MSTIPDLFSPSREEGKSCYQNLPPELKLMIYEALLDEGKFESLHAVLDAFPHDLAIVEGRRGFRRRYATAKVQALNLTTYQLHLLYKVASLHVPPGGSREDSLRYLKEASEDFWRCLYTCSYTRRDEVELEFQPHNQSWLLRLGRLCSDLVYATKSAGCVILGKPTVIECLMLEFQSRHFRAGIKLHCFAQCFEDNDWGPRFPLAISPFTMDVFSLYHNRFLALKNLENPRRTREEGLMTLWDPLAP
ncbi:hypothetical protein QBC44DRAFT_303063 [Cladorrhinum sp. PSN332]|nr:hypothetical protein QBC44DRAFT_303063 [Cladorrhinum sp. PSN332]